MLLSIIESNSSALRILPFPLGRHNDLFHLLGFVTLILRITWLLLRLRRLNAVRIASWAISHPTRITPIQRIIADIRIEIYVILVADRIDLQEPPPERE